MSSVDHGRGISDIALITQTQGADKARSGDINIYGLRILDMPTSSDLPSTSLISTPFTCPQACPFEYPYPTPNVLSASPPSRVPSNLATFSFPLGLNPDSQADSLPGKGFPIRMSLLKRKRMNGIKPPIPPGLMQKAAVLPSMNLDH